MIIGPCAGLVTGGERSALLVSCSLYTLWLRCLSEAIRNHDFLQDN